MFTDRNLLLLHYRPGQFSKGSFPGFNGMEKDDEMKGDGNSYDFGARVFDPRVGRWGSLDPLISAFPHESPYIFAGNNPIFFIDHDGKFKYPAGKKEQYERDYPVLTHILKNLSAIADDPSVMESFKQITWYDSKAELESVTTYNNDKSPVLYVFWPPTLQF